MRESIEEKTVKVVTSVEHNPTFTSTRLSSVYGIRKSFYIPEMAGQRNECENLLFCHYTNFAREDYNWQKLPQLLNDRFEKQDRVNVNFHGGSDGSDAYTFIINMIKFLGEKAKKFFPVNSSDISPELIKNADKGKILLHNRDVEYLQKNDALKFFERDDNEELQVMRNIEFFPYRVKPELRDKIEFSLQDVRHAVRENDYSDSVFFFRNGWGFNTLDEQNEIARNLYENSNAKTLVGIGQSDLYKSDASDALQRNNFKGIDTDVFTFAENNYPGSYIGTPDTTPEYKEYGFFEK